MYKLSKSLIVLIVILLMHSGASAQLFKLPKIQVIANANYASPANDLFKSGFKAGAGAEAGAGVGLGSTMLMGTLGVQSFGATSNNTSGTLNLTSMKAGIRQYFLWDIFLYWEI